MGETRWLDGTEMSAWRGLVEMSRLLFTQLERELGEHELSLGDYEIFVRLSEQPERAMRMTDLARATLSSKSRLSHQVSRLAARGLLARASCRTDGRGASAVLTDAGYALLERAAPTHVRGVREHLLDLLRRDDIAALGEVTRRVNAHLDASVHP